MTLDATLRAIRPDRPGLRWLWILGGSFVAIALLGVGSTQMLSLLAHEEETIVRTFDAGDVAALDVTSSGRIEVIASDGPEIVVTANVSRGLSSTDHREEIVGDTLELHAGCNRFISKFCGVDYTVEVPADVTVTARSSNAGVMVNGMRAGVTARSQNGSVTASDVSGTIELRSENGAVTAEINEGSLQAHAENGSIRVAFAASPEAVDASSDNGSVLVVVPDDDQIAYALDASSDDGRVRDDVRTDPTSDRTIRARSDNGSVTVRYP